MGDEHTGDVLADVANYTTIAPVLQTSEIVGLQQQFVREPHAREDDRQPDRSDWVKVLRGRVAVVTGAASGSASESLERWQAKVSI